MIFTYSRELSNQSLRIGTFLKIDKRLIHYTESMYKAFLRKGSINCDRL